MRTIDRFDLHSVSLVMHPPREGCVTLGPEQTFCPGCGVGYVHVVAEGVVSEGMVAVPPPCPECQVSKHEVCDGRTWDNAADAPAPCPCAEAGHA